MDDFRKRKIFEKKIVGFEPVLFWLACLWFVCQVTEAHENGHALFSTCIGTSLSSIMIHLCFTHGSLMHTYDLKEKWLSAGFEPGFFESAGRGLTN